MSVHLLFSILLCQIIVFIPILFLLFLAVLGLRCCPGFPLAVARRGYSPVVVDGLLTAVTSAAEHRLQDPGLSNCGSPALDY